MESRGECQCDSQVSAGFSQPHLASFRTGPQPCCPSASTPVDHNTDQSSVLCSSSEPHFTPAPRTSLHPTNPLQGLPPSSTYSGFFPVALSIPVAGCLLCPTPRPFPWVPPAPSLQALSPSPSTVPALQKEPDLPLENRPVAQWNLAAGLPTLICPMGAKHDCKSVLMRVKVEVYRQERCGRGSKGEKRLHVTTHGVC